MVDGPKVDSSVNVPCLNKAAVPIDHITIVLWPEGHQSSATWFCLILINTVER